MFPLIHGLSIFAVPWLQGIISVPRFLMLVAVVVGLVILLLLVVLAARMFGRRENKETRTGREPIEVSPPPSAAPVAAAEAAVAPDAGAVQPVRWLVQPDGQKVQLNKLPLQIGRAKTNQLAIEHPSLADVHARIYLDEAENVLCIEDASDGNSALLVNGSPTRKNILSNHDQIALGDVIFQYQEAAPGHSAAARG